MALSFASTSALFLLGIGISNAQTISTGDVTGEVRDTSGAIVPSATVTLKNGATGDIRTTRSNNAGVYRFTYVKPAIYQISAASTGLKSDVMSNVTVGVGQVQTLSLSLKPVEVKEVVLVTDAAPLLQTDNANIALTFSSRQIDLLPIPGGDITTMAFTMPGVVVSTGAGYGNFSSHGLPSIANLFTTNGVDNLDPFLSIANSGASNLTLGANEIQETAVVQNAYSPQYGRQAGAQVNFITKSGANDFHGNLLYEYNGSVMNANSFFSNATGTPRARALSNRYAALMGGRIVRDKLFFLVDTEGLRYTLPTRGVVSIPSAALQSYVLRTVSAAQRPFYQQAFNLYNNAPGVNRGVPVTNGDGPLQDGNGALGCGTLNGTPTGSGGTFGQNVSCANAFGANVSNQNAESLFTTRVDYNVSDRHKVFFRFKTDHGVQPTETSPISAAFNAESTQPSYDGQVKYTAVFSPQMVNDFLGSSTYYKSIFSPADLQATLTAFPAQLVFLDGGANGTTSPTWAVTGGLSQIGLSNSTFPQGRRFGQLQLVDDISYNFGRHMFKAGVNYRYNRIADMNNERLLFGGRYQIFGLDEFAAGAINPASGTNYQQRYTPFGVVHLRTYNLGFYLQDEWAAKPNLKITYGLRLDRTGNPNCTDNCFARLNSPFESLTKGSSIPYNQSIQTGLSNAFYDVEPVVPQPRLSVAYSPSWSRTTVLRGGIGLFSDMYPGALISSITGNSPNVFTPSVRVGAIDAGGAGSAPAISIATGRAFQSGFDNGATLAQLRAALAPVTFTPPPYFSIPSHFKVQKFLEWSFEVQHEIGLRSVLTLSYVGNRGYDLFLRNLKANASASAATYPNGFDGLPATAPDPRFRIITDLSNNGYSNYDGLSVSLRRQLGRGFQGQFGYTWSHALDTVSNDSLTLPFSSDSQTSQNHPSRVGALNYSSADYDVRHNVAADFIWELPFRFGNGVANRLLGGWSVSSKLYARTGTPFSVFNSRLPGRLSSSVGGTILATLLDPNVNAACDSSAVNNPCFTTDQFATTTTQKNFGNLPRNSFRAPGYFDIDSAVYKVIGVGERVKFTLGASAFNLLNHPNFGSPGQDVAAGGLGLISSTVAPPTSAYGSFQGSAVSGRVLVVTVKFGF
jgi:hypothetical protein